MTKFGLFVVGTVLCFTTRVSSGIEEDLKKPESTVCQDKPADVVFILDSSESIEPLDFQKQLQFVQNVVDVFDMTPNKTRIGVLSFSNWAFLDFHLNGYQSKGEVREAISNIRQIRGDTNTAAALRYTRKISFREEHGARKGIPHIAIILTDGKSNEPVRTAKEADYTQRAGIHMLAVGVGEHVAESELRALASAPEYVYRVDSYAALQTIKNMLAIDTCKLTELPEITTTEEPMAVDQARMAVCGHALLQDLALAVSPTGSANETNAGLEFYQRILANMDLRDDKLRVAMVPKSCQEPHHMSLTDAAASDKMALLAHVDSLLASDEPSMASVHQYMRRHSFSAHNGGRREAKRTGVVIVSESDQVDMIRALREAAKSRIMGDIELFVIGVGKELDLDDLEHMASEPPSAHVFHVANYNELLNIADSVQRAICPLPQI